MKKKFIQKYYNFLNNLKKKGVATMFGAQPHLMKEFPSLSQKVAKDILVDWMEISSKN